GYPATSPHSGGGRHPSECPADIARNGWPACVGISGRLGSEYAAILLSCPPLPGNVDQITGAEG
ncbi:MAG: hypothetical protein ACT4PG_11930, partial [Panacagrimonas sp.]